MADLSWFCTDGQEMTEEDWNDPLRACLGVRLAGDAIPEIDRRGNPIKGDTLLLLLNGHHEVHGFKLPAHRPDVEWELMLDTRYDTGLSPQRIFISGDEEYEMMPRSLALFRLCPRADSSARSISNLQAKERL